MTAKKLPRGGLWSEPVFLGRMRDVGRKHYHDKHPFHLRLEEGRLPLAAIRCWIRNRFYYQRNIPIKDAFILTNAPRHVRKIWIHRIGDHDGVDATGWKGGISTWVRLDLGVSGEAPPGFARKSSRQQEAILQAHEEKLESAPVLPGVRAAVDAYVDFARDSRWELAVASSLTEMFAPDLMIRRLAGLERHYPSIPAWSYDYFRNRPPLARRDQKEAWALTAQSCTTPGLQRQAVAALRFKCDLLWRMLDAITAASCDIPLPG
jgi:pyrroloquinoline-quinone synthase